MSQLEICDASNWLVEPLMSPLPETGPGSGSAWVVSDLARISLKLRPLIPSGSSAQALGPLDLGRQPAPGTWLFRLKVQLSTFGIPCLLMVGVATRRAVLKSTTTLPYPDAFFNVWRDASAVTLIRPLGPADRAGDGDGSDVQAECEREGVLLHVDAAQGREDCLLLCGMCGSSCRFHVYAVCPTRCLQCLCRCNRAARSISTMK